MFQQEYGLDKMWAHNNAGTVGFILIRTLKRDLAECGPPIRMGDVSRPVPKPFFDHCESAGFVELILWYLGWGCVTNHSAI